MMFGAMTACHHLRGGILGAPSGGPRMSPTPRPAQYAATHSANRLPGLEITSPWVRISTMAEWQRWHCKRSARVSAVELGGCCNAAILPIARHLRSCAGFTCYIRSACKRYAPVAQDHYYCLLQKVCPAPRGAGHGDTSSEKLGYFTTTDCVLPPVLTM